jgi:murein DD-endopeptidase MepM/ murein hydrolase activator NlpD
MIGDGWSSLSRGRRALLLLALAAIGYLLFQTRTPPARLSGWSGNPFVASAAGGAAGAEAAALLQPRIAAPTAVAPQPVVGVAQAGRGSSGDDDTPTGNPLHARNTVMTQGYGVGSHAPAEIWGAVDLALDGNGDGQADPDGSWNAPVYATHRGVIHLARDTWPAGNHIWVEGANYKTGYSHLQDFAPGLQDGQVVERGQLIAFLGSTGEASGPHLDYQVWKDGVNVNPLDYGALDTQ